MEFTLSDGNKVPSLGFGTWKMENHEAAIAVKDAIKSGYRHIDTARAYQNEEGVGKGIQDSGIKREELFLTTKLFNGYLNREDPETCISESLKKLGVNYLDLLLIHWPATANYMDEWQDYNLKTWRVLERYVKEGVLRSIGVSNFLPWHLEALLEKAEIRPAVNQVECHPGYIQRGVCQYCKNKGILVEAWSPLGNGNVLSDPRLSTIADKYSKNTAQLSIRWNLQNGVLPLPKASSQKHMVNNLQVFDFEITADDMLAIDSLPLLGYSGLDPDLVKF